MEEAHLPESIASVIDGIFAPIELMARNELYLLAIDLQRNAADLDRLLTSLGA